MHEHDLTVSGLVKTFGTHRAVDSVSFTVPKGSFFSILGPSGCGKTTLMRMLAGFSEPDAGTIQIGGRSMLGIKPNRRPVNMVFQNLALFPMMSVAENIAYGLKRRGIRKSEREERVARILARVGLPQAGSKRIDQLSGGQKQRVAIARALVLEPELLLLDEPLGALDLKLREHMKVELKQLQRDFNTTFVYITHDQSEALVMSDTVAVMNHGRFKQVGTPQDLYYRPQTSFVAGFVGQSNVWRGRADGMGVMLDGVRIAAQSRFAAGADVEVFVRPEAISLARAKDNLGGLDNLMAANVETIFFDGAASCAAVRPAAGPEIRVALPQNGAFADLQRGDEVWIGWSADAALCFVRAS